MITTRTFKFYICSSIDPTTGTSFDADKFINSYIKEVQRTLRLESNEHNINKRSLPDVDLYQLHGK